MKEEKQSAGGNWIEPSIKIAGPLLAALGLIIGVWEYQHQQAFNDSQEFKRTTWNKRLNAYEEIGTVAAQLVTAYHDSIRFDSLSAQFSILYWGKMPLVDDPDVEVQLKAFNDEVIDVKYGEGNEVRLKAKGYKLMKACQKSLHDSWYENTNN